jgi:hypothetical protein
MLFYTYRNQDNLFLIKALPGGPILVPIKAKLYLKNYPLMLEFAEKQSRKIG